MVTERQPNEFGVQAVPFATVDGIVAADRRVAVVQLDVEGHEQSALIGAMATIERCRPIAVPGRLAHSTPRLTLHRPTAWPRQTPWQHVAAAANSPPLAA